MGLIISVSGIRGKVGSDLTVSDALKLAMLFGRFVADGSKPLVVASDSRISSPALRSAVISGLLAVGRHVIDLALAATPTSCLMVRHCQAAGGMIVTASHNPIEWNGIKLIGPDGLSLDSQRAEQIREAFGGPMPVHAGPVDCGRLERRHQIHQFHIDAVLRHCDRKLVDELRFRKRRVVLDCINGAGAVAGDSMLEALGCEPIVINGEPNGRFAHLPEPVPENLTALAAAVVEHDAQVGFAQDPDADRLAIVDETGRCIGEEYTLALASWYVLSVTPGPVSANLSTSRMVDDVAERFGQTVIRTPVGETNVARAILDNNCPIGGEGNGGVIWPVVVPVRDSFSAMALVLQLMAKTGRSISELVADLPRYCMVKAKVECSPEQAEQACRRLAEKFSDQPINTSDGVRIDFPDDKAWVHVRASNTEPIVRVIAEATEQAKTDELVDMAMSMGLA